MEIKIYFSLMSLIAAFKRKLKWRTLHWFVNKPKEEFVPVKHVFFLLSQPIRPSPRKGASLRGILCPLLPTPLHQWSSLALSRHHDSNSSHACQSGGTNLWGHSGWRCHLRLRPLSSFGVGDRRAPENLRRSPVCTRRPPVFTRRRASDVVARKPL